MEKLNEKVGDLRNILESILVELESREEKVDLDVLNQHSRFYKFGCWLVFGHLYDKKNICKRCGKEKIVKL
jgi:hypothetical protein